MHTSGHILEWGTFEFLPKQLVDEAVNKLPKKQLQRNLFEIACPDMKYSFSYREKEILWCAESFGDLSQAQGELNSQPFSVT